MEKKDLYSKLDLERNYKLVPLVPDLVTAIKKNEILTIKSSAHELVLTSESKTFQVRQKNHSNTQLLMQRLHEDEAAIALANFSNELELKVAKGSIEYGDTPIYSGDFKKLIQQSSSDSVEQLLAKSPISSKEFYEQWVEINGSEVDGRAVLLSQDFVTEVLTTIINTVIANSLDPNDPVNLTTIYKLMDDEENTITIDIVNTILLKFSIDSTHSDIDFKLDMEKISTWYGIHSLKLFANSCNISVDEFLIKWRSTLPSALSTSLDLSNLQGSYYSPFPSLIRYINKNTLPNDPTSRFKNLFLLQKNWLLDEIEPFVKDLNIKNLKISSFLMKYARVKKQGGKTIVTSR